MLMRDKVCVVTGAASPQSIGRATACLVAQHGARVAVLDVSSHVHDAAREIGAAYPDTTAIGVACDIVSRAACAAAAAEVLRTFGRVDALIHCAGIVRSARYGDISDASFDEVIDVNLAGTFNVITAFTSTMVTQRSGAIVAVASVAAQRGGGLVGGAHYAASKGGVISLVKSLARELGSAGVRANAVCPSLIETATLTQAIGRERIREITAAVPLGRPGRPEDVAGACLFLSCDLSSYITGATIDVNGGSHIH